MSNEEDRSPAATSRNPSSARYEQLIHVEPGGTAYVVLHGDIHIRNGHPVYRFELFPAQPVLVDADRARAQPSRLLAAESQVVRFVGRASELANLAAWRDDPAPGVSAFLLHGPGGQGKTRLAVQFASESADQGWTVWAGHHVSDPTSAMVAAPGDTGTTLVVIVEYAERWPADDLQLLLLNPLLRRPDRTRVLLVSRPAEVWWPALRHRLGKAEVAVGGSIELQPLTTTAADRRELFEQAKNQFAAVMHASAHDLPAPPDLADKKFELVLTVHTAALVAVDAHLRGEIPPVDPGELSAYLLDREHDYWQSMSGRAEDAISPRTMARTVYTATLTRPMRPSQARTVLARVGLVTTDTADRVLADHSACYPPADPDLVLTPLYPDRLGEDFVALLTPGHHVAGYGPDQWAASAPGLLLDSTVQPGGQDIWTRPILATLIETSHRWVHIAARLFALLFPQPQLALVAGGAALARLAQIPDIPLELLEGIERHFPEGRDIDLDLGIAVVVERLTSRRLEDTPSDAQRAAMISDLSRRYYYAGMLDQALTLLTQAVLIQRRLTVADQDAPTIRLAGMLSNLGKLLAEADQPAAGLASSWEAVEIYRGLPSLDPWDQLDFGTLLSNLATRFRSLGMREDAVQTSIEALGIIASLKEENLAGTTLTRRAAATLTNLSITLLELTQRESAYAASKQALSLWLRLAAIDPSDAPELAGALSSYAGMSHHLGMASQALAASQRAVDIDRHLALANPTAFTSSLAESLITLGTVLSSRPGRLAESVAVNSEAVETLRDLYALNPGRFAAKFATALHNLSIGLAEIGERDQAVEVSWEAVSIRRALVNRNPAAHLADLGSTLSSLGGFLNSVDRQSEALEIGREAIELHRQLGAADSKIFAAGLGRALINHSCTLSALQQHEEALQASQEAVTLYRRLYGDSSSRTDAQELALALENLATDLIRLGRMGDARDASQEATTLRRQLAHPDSETSIRDLAVGLVAHAKVLSRTTGDAAAAEAYLEAADTYRKVFQADPAEFGFPLANALSSAASCLYRLNRGPSAVEVSVEAVSVRRQCIAEHPDAVEHNLARELWLLARNRLAAMIDLREALREAGEAVTIFARLADRDATRYAKGLKVATSMLADVQTAINASQKTDSQAASSSRDPGRPIC